MLCLYGVKRAGVVRVLHSGRQHLCQCWVGIAAATDIGEESGLARVVRRGRVEEREDHLYL